MGHVCTRKGDTAWLVPGNAAGAAASLEQPSLGHSLGFSQASLACVLLLALTSPAPGTTECNSQLCQESSQVYLCPSSLFALEKEGAQQPVSLTACHQLCSQHQDRGLAAAAQSNQGSQLRRRKTPPTKALI